VTTFGWDMSHFDAPSIGNAIGEGIEFITHKAGGDAVDAELSIWWNNVKDLRNPLLVGAYWVLYPGSPASRADAFIARLDDACPGWRDEPFMLQADCEQWNGNKATTPSITEINTFCARLEDRLPKLQPVVYAPKWVYGSKVSGLTNPLWASAYVLGSGSFKDLYPGDSSSRWAAYGGKGPAILQYTSSATIGGQTTCDANAFKGTLTQLKALVAPGWDDNVLLTSDDIQAIWDYPLNVQIDTTKPANMQPAGGILRYLSPYSVAIRDAAQAAQAGSVQAVSLLTQLAAQPEVDETKLASDLAAALVPHLPQGNISTMELAQAILSMIQIKTA
jgi:hypothetical protein